MRYTSWALLVVDALLVTSGFAWRRSGTVGAHDAPCVETASPALGERKRCAQGVACARIAQNRVLPTEQHHHPGPVSPVRPALRLHPGQRHPAGVPLRAVHPAIVPDPESLCVGLARLELATRTRKRQLLEAHGAGSMPEDAEPLSDWLLRYKDQLRGEDLAAEGRSLLASAPRGRGPILPNPISFTTQEPPPPFDPDLNAQLQAGRRAPALQQGLGALGPPMPVPRTQATQVRCSATCTMQCSRCLLSLC